MRSWWSCALLPGALAAGACGGQTEDPFTLSGVSASQASAGDGESAETQGSEAGGTTTSDGGDAATTGGDGDTSTSSGDGDGDGNTATSSGDGDGTTATSSGDGDGTASGDGDGTASGDGDGTAGDGDGTTSGGTSGGCGLNLSWTFEGSDDGFTSAATAGSAAASTWAHGVPLNGPQGAQSVWATSLSGTHNVGECSAIVSPVFSLAGCSAASLSVRHWFSFDTNSCWPDCGGGVVQVSTNGGAGWTSLVSPGYTTGSLEWLGSVCTPPVGEKGWNGSSGGWVTDTADLSAWVGNDTVQVRFLLGAKGSPWFANLGWYIDEVSVN